MKDLKINFCPELQQMLLNGATIINYYIGKYKVTILVRLPKGKFYKTEDNIKFEYTQFDQDKDLYMYHAISRNGHVREVKRKVSDSHYKDEVHYQMMADRKIENK